MNEVDRAAHRREQNRLAQKRARDRKRRASALPHETEHSREVVEEITAERHLTPMERELVRQSGQVLAELEELDKILRYRTADWLQAALEDVEERFGPGVQVFLNPDPMLAAVDRKRTLLKGLVGELRQWRAMAERNGAGSKAPPVPATQPTALHAAESLDDGTGGDYDLFGAG